MAPYVGASSGGFAIRGANYRVVRRLIAAVLAGAGAFIVSAIVLAITDIYLSGHGMRTLGSRPLLVIQSVGMQLSVADCIAFAAAGAATIVTLARPRRG
jgi:hypothetical protein